MYVDRTAVVFEAKNYEIKPNPEFLKSVKLKTRKAWGEALRQKGLRQITGTLKTIPVRGGTPGYCCLGIFEEKVAGEEIPMENSRGLPRDVDERESHVSTLSYEVANKFFGGASDPEIALVTTLNGDGDTYTDTAAIMNDEHKLSFKQIADLVHPEGAQK